MAMPPTLLFRRGSPGVVHWRSPLIRLFAFTCNRASQGRTKARGVARGLVATSALWGKRGSVGVHPCSGEKVGEGREVESSRVSLFVSVAKNRVDEKRFDNRRWSHGGMNRELDKQSYHVIQPCGEDLVIMLRDVNLDSHRSFLPHSAPALVRSTFVDLLPRSEQTATCSSRLTLFDSFLSRSEHKHYVQRLEQHVIQQGPQRPRSPHRAGQDGMSKRRRNCVLRAPRSCSPLPSSHLALTLLLVLV